MRTNNSAEAYHRRIGSVFQCAHPTLWIFLEKLIAKESNIHADILQVKAGQPLKNKKKNQHFEMRLLNLISTPHADIITQIDSIAHNVTLQFFLNSHVSSYLIFINPAINFLLIFFICA
jgi:hypothetical protein